MTSSIVRFKMFSRRASICAWSGFDWTGPSSLSESFRADRDIVVVELSKVCGFVCFEIMVEIVG